MNLKDFVTFILTVSGQRSPAKDFIVSKDQDRLMQRLAGDIDQYVAINGSAHKVKVLFIPSYYMITFTRMFDILMALSLRLRGAEIIPVLSDPLFSEQFFFGGIYTNAGNGSSYAATEKRIWKDLLGTKPVCLSDFYSESDDRLAADLSSQVTFENYRQITYRDYPVGKKAGEVTANLNNLPGVINRSDVVDQLRNHVWHIVRLIGAYERSLETINPDTIFSNVPFYYKWNIPYHIASRRNVPFYSATLSERKNTFLFSCNTDDLLDISPAWQSFKAIELSKDTQAILDDLITARAQGKTDAYSPYPLPGQETEEHQKLLGWLDNGKPLVIFPINILYDAAVYQDSSLVETPLELIHEVIAFFNLHPEYQLIIKAHPAERLAYESRSNLFTKFCLRNVLRTMDRDMNPNIYFMDYNTAISMSDLVPLSDLGIVYTSSTAMEMAWAGKPVITVANSHYSGKGFTYEPATLDELFVMVSRILSEGEPASIIKERTELSRKYYWLYYYHARIDFKLFQGSDVGTIPTRLLFESYEELLPGKNSALDYVCDAILNKLPIYGDHRWPPASV